MYITLSVTTFVVPFGRVKDVFWDMPSFVITNIDRVKNIFPPLFNF